MARGRKPPGAVAEVDGYWYDAAGVPVKRPGELGPPGLLVRRPARPHTEHRASCLGCRRLILVYAFEDGTSLAWAMGPVDRFASRQMLGLFGAWTDQEFAPACAAPEGRFGLRCPGGSPHFIELDEKGGG